MAKIFSETRPDPPEAAAGAAAAAAAFCYYFFSRLFMTVAIIAWLESGLVAPFSN